ncbi:hypothetical protein CONLIGDRAFT_401657 [Coniochaeta ligniaria NRRL 30616]|uniref:Uncharacterized protein n=1 Tax=Coniochaeta ligniaria NRRL 30616 TaxID=1408157 RepID=A0A1J7J6P9_9PEZI|nr:hypothetical protein CONLIGDRAFT_401657 [Coniochaeta ligniaria NRRL 30616]
MALPTSGAGKPLGRVCASSSSEREKANARYGRYLAKVAKVAKVPARGSAYSRKARLCRILSARHPRFSSRTRESNPWSTTDSSTSHTPSRVRPMQASEGWRHDDRARTKLLGSSRWHAGRRGFPVSFSIVDGELCHLARNESSTLLAFATLSLPLVIRDFSGDYAGHALSLNVC